MYNRTKAAFPALNTRPKLVSVWQVQFALAPWIVCVLETFRSWGKLEEYMHRSVWPKCGKADVQRDKRLVIEV